MIDPDLLNGTNLAVFDSFYNEKKCHNALNVVRGIERFIDSNFRGLAEIKVDFFEDAVLFISAESLAMFFREIFEFVFWRALLKISFGFEQGRLIMHLSSVPEIECSFDEASRFIRLARDIGFDLVRDGDRVLFTVDCTQNMSYRIYVPLYKDAAARIAEIFEDVFTNQKSSARLLITRKSNKM